MTVTVRSLLEDAVKRGKAWSYPFDAIDPTGADDHFFNIRNQGNKTFAIVELEISSTVAGNVEPTRNRGGAATSGTEVEPVPLGVDKGKPELLVETGVDLQLTAEGAVGKLGLYYLAADTPRLLPVYWVIPGKRGIHLNWEVATGILTGQALVIELTPEDDPTQA